MPPGMMPEAITAATHSAAPDSVGKPSSTARAVDGLQGMFKKFLPPRLAKHHVASETLRTIGVYGPAARAVVSRVTGHSEAVLGTLAPYHHRALNDAGADAIVARSPDAGVEGYDCFVAAAEAPQWHERFRDAGAVAVGLDAWEIARIEAGRPEWGLDMDDATIPQEANFDALHAISYTKGCYTGQETIARVHFRGHVNRHLRGLVAADVDLPMGATLHHEDKDVGNVRSSAHSPRLGSIALAMVRREIAVDAELSVRWDGGSAVAVVRDLPFA